MLFPALSCASGLLGSTQFASGFFADRRSCFQGIGYFAARFLTHRWSGFPSLGQVAAPFFTKRWFCFKGNRKLMPRFFADWRAAFLSLGYIPAPVIICARHTILVLARSLVSPFAALLPDRPPFLKRQQELDATRPGLSALTLKGYLDVVRFSPLTLVICVISHWFLSPRTVVRGDISVSAPMPPHLYHTISAAGKR